VGGGGAVDGYDDDVFLGHLDRPFS